MWQTLPPIRSSDQAESGSSVRPGRAEQRAQQQTGQERRRRPEPPRPAVLHLGVTARSHSLVEYQTHFPTQFNTHYINRYNWGQNIQTYKHWVRIKKWIQSYFIIIFLSGLSNPSVFNLGPVQTCPPWLWVPREMSSHTCSPLYYSMTSFY